MLHPAYLALVCGASWQDPQQLPRYPASRSSCLACLHCCTQELEEDEDLRSRVALYKDPNYQAPPAGAAPGVASAAGYEVRTPACPPTALPDGWGWLPACRP